MLNVSDKLFQDMNAFDIDLSLFNVNRTEMNHRTFQWHFTIGWLLMRGEVSGSSERDIALRKRLLGTKVISNWGF